MTAERGETCDFCEVVEVGDSVFHSWLKIESTCLFRRSLEDLFRL